MGHKQTSPVGSSAMARSKEQPGGNAQDPPLRAGEFLQRDPRLSLERLTDRNLDRQRASQVTPSIMGQHERGSEGLSAIDGENAGPMQMGIMA
jgi:hypothetical protein